MALKFTRNFKEGRQSEQFLNDELITLYETLKYLPHHKQDHDGAMPPAAKLSGAINAQIPSKVGEDSSLNYWDAGQNAWVPFFARKFQITDQLLVQEQPANPVTSQLWINNGALFYFDGKDWRPVKTTEADDSQWASGAFADFQIVSPLNPVGQNVVPVSSGVTGKDEFIYHYEATFIIGDPSRKIYATDRVYHSGQSEVTVHINGILLACGRDWEEVKSDGTTATERSTPCRAIGFKIDLQTNDVVTYHISRKMLPTATQSNSSNQLHINEDYYQYFYENEIDYIDDNIVIPSSQKWTPDWISPELEVPEEILVTDEYLSQFPVPSLKTDRIFIDNSFDQSYDKLTSICFQYKTNRILGHTVSAVHMNPARLTRIRKRLIKVDKLNATIAVSPYNTEFYGYRKGERGGSFLIPSNSQDYGDYIPVGDYIVLNYHSNQNYDYVLAITYEFTWMKADGSMSKNSLNSLSNSFYLSNLRAPVNIHVNGLKLEEASYDVDLGNKVLRINDDASNVSVQAWSPYKKQFGYIRETDLEHRGIIRLHEPVRVPLVFVGGTLIHPLYGGLEFDKDKIYVPNSGDKNQMLNMQWCVVDLISDDMEVQYQQSGHATETYTYYESGPEDVFVPPNEMYYAGTLSDQPDSKGIYDYILASGTLHGVTGNVIRYDPTKIKPNDGVLLFVDGLLIDEKDIIRDPEEGIITITDGLTEDQEYVLLKDQDGAIYNSSNMIPAFGTGYLSESLVYLNGKLLCNSNCVATIKTPQQEVVDGAVDHEIKYFIENEITGEGTWKIYNQYQYRWDAPTDDEIEEVCTIINSYENMLTSIRFDIDIDKENDEVAIYTFRFANDLSGITDVGLLSYEQDDEDGVPLYKPGTAFYGYNQGMLNLWKNGVKLINGRDYEEHPQGKLIRILTDIKETDKIQYVIEPIERGYSQGHTFVVLSNADSIQSNIYKIPDHITTSLYPGRVTVYINGIRLPNEDWVLLTNKSIMLRYTDYKAVGSAYNYPDEEFTDKNYHTVTATHTYPDEILIEIRYDYERQEKTIYFPVGTALNELSIEDFELDKKILESADEILFYLNGQFTGLSRNKNDDYRLDRYNGCILFMNSDFVEAASKDVLKNLFNQNNYIYTAWKQMTGQSEYVSDKKNALTIVWR